MEKKQLNFSAPLLSARRYSSPLRSSGDLEQKNDFLTDRRNSVRVHPQQPQKAEFKTSEEALKPVSVPFHWEQIPGKAKGGNHHSQYYNSEEPASTPPRLLPGRTLDLVPWHSGRNSGELSGFKSPNKLSGELGLIRPQHRFSGEVNGGRHYCSTKFLSGEVNGVRPLSKLSSGNNSFVIMDSSREGINRIAGFNYVSDGDGDDSDEDAAYSNAIDALESHSVNCSISGVSGSECHSKKPSEELSLDVQSRDFMINRFLPAAKAMTLDTPQYASNNKKQLVVVEQPKEPQQCKALVPRLIGPPPPNQSLALAITPYTGQDIGEVSEEDSEIDAYEGVSYSQPRNNMAVKTCGFFPWICAKNSLKFLNPLPAMKVKTKNALSSATKLVKNASYKSPSRALSKHVPCTSNKPKVSSTFKSCELNVPKLQSRPMFYSGELQARNGLSPYRNYRRSNNASPRRCDSPQFAPHKGVGFPASPKRVDSYSSADERRYYEKDSNRSDQRSSRHRSTHGSGYRSPMAEKTLYVDSVNNIAKIPQWSSISSKPKQIKESDLGNVSRRENATANILKARGYSGPLACGTFDAVRDQPNITMKSESRYKQRGEAADGSLNMNRELILVGDSLAIQSPLTPPLPKSPSESWLSRNLNSGSPRSSFSHSTLSNKYQPRNQSSKTPPAAASAAVTKWEHIVKSSYTRYDYGRYSEELVTHVPHSSRTRK